MLTRKKQTCVKIETNFVGELCKISKTPSYRVTYT